MSYRNGNRIRLALRNIPRFNSSPSFCSAPCAGSGESFSAFTQLVQILMRSVSNRSDSNWRLQIWQVAMRRNLRASNQKLINWGIKIAVPKNTLCLQILRFASRGFASIRPARRWANSAKRETTRQHKESCSLLAFNTRILVCAAVWLSMRAPAKRMQASFNFGGVVGGVSTTVMPDAPPNVGGWRKR